MTSPPQLPITTYQSPRRRAYSLIEALIALLIIQVIASLVFYSVQSTTDASHLDTMTKDTIGALRYARALSMSANLPVNVDFNTSAQTINVYLNTSTTPVANPMFPKGSCSFDLKNDQGIAGCKITSVTNCPTNGTNIYRLTYSVLGTRTNAPSFATPMTVTFAYGGATATLTIPNAGDPN
ncbi:MAG: pilus assembly FimT family protein [Phycisphaerae bacterium]